MINCKKCKTQNETTARFCFQCGVKLSSGLANLNTPRPQRQNKTRFVTALDPETFITHPHQKKEEVITRSNQGTMIVPELKEKLGLNQEKPKVQPKKPVPKPAKIPQPIRVKQTAGPMQSVQKPQPSPQRQTVPKAKTPPVKKTHRPPLLTPTDKLTLQKQMPSRAVPGVKPVSEAFPMMNINRLEEQKAQLKKMHARRQQIQEDLAYLDELLPREEEAQKTKAISQKQVQVPTKVAVKPPVKPTEPEVFKQETKPSPIPEEFSEPVTPSLLPSSKTRLETQGWLQTIRLKRQSSPSEQLQNYQHGDSSEFITPFLTVAALVYFCYVLYI